MPYSGVSLSRLNTGSNPVESARLFSTAGRLGAAGRQHGSCGPSRPTLAKPCERLVHPPTQPQGRLRIQRRSRVYFGLLFLTLGA